MPASHTTDIDDTACLLFAEKLSLEVKGAEAAKKWSATTARGLLELVGAQKGLMEPTDVVLLREVKTKFKAAGITQIGAREKAVAMMQAFLTPKAVPKSEDKAFLAKEFLKAAQAGAIVEMGQMLTAHPSVSFRHVLMMVSSTDGNRFRKLLRRTFHTSSSSVHFGYIPRFSGSGGGESCFLLPFLPLPFRLCVRAKLPSALSLNESSPWPVRVSTPSNDARLVLFFQRSSDCCIERSRRSAPSRRSRKSS